MTALPNPFDPADHTPRSADPAPTSSPCPNSDVGAEPFDEPPLRDEPIPLFLTEPAPEMDRELEAMLKVLIAKRASRRTVHA